MPADLPFLNYAFTATGGSTPRTMPQRLTDVINVLDYGADPTGATDSTTAIQAAINAAAANGVTTGVGTNKGSAVFFPAGQYQVNGTLTNNPSGNSAVGLIGSGKRSTSIIGTNNSGFLISSGIGTFEELNVIEGLTIKNLSTTVNTGAVSMALLSTARVRSCSFTGMYCIKYDNNTFNSTIEDCDLIGPATYNSGSVGMTAGQNGVYNCKFSNLGVGLRGYNGGFFMAGCDFENCGEGWVLGQSADGSANQIVAWAGTALTFNNCNRAIWMNTAFSGVLMGVKITGTTGANGSGKPQYGLYIDNVANVSIMGVEANAQFSAVGIYCNNYGYTLYDCNAVIASGGTGTAWRLQQVGIGGFTGADFINCNNPAFIRKFSDLPAASGAEGAAFDISDGSVASNGPGGGQWGGTVTGGGSAHVNTRSNGTAWTAMGL